MTFPDEENTNKQPGAEPGGTDPGRSHPDQYGAANEGWDSEDKNDFSRTEEDVEAFRRELENIRFRAPQPAPEEERATPATPAPAPRRRRRGMRIIDRPDAREVGQRIESIVLGAAPTFDFFVFSFLSGCILAIGYILDAPAILLIGALVAPILAPWIGTAISVATGEIRVFWQSLGGMLTAIFMVFLLGLLAGLAARIFLPLTLSQAFYHARLWWPDLFMLIIGTVLLVFAFIQSNEKPLVASLMVAFQFYLPASAAGFGLGSGVEGLWPQAGLVFLVHVALSLVVALTVFFYMGFRPLHMSGYALATVGIIGALLILASFAGAGGMINVQGALSSATPHESEPTLTAQPTTASSGGTVALPSLTPRPVILETPTATVTMTLEPATSTPAATSTEGPTLVPTPVYGRVQSKSGGVYVRVKPGGSTITTVSNGYLVEILPDKPIVLDGATWIHVIIKTPTRDIDGWVLLDLILTATPFGSP